MRSEPRRGLTWGIQQAALLFMVGGGVVCVLRYRVPQAAEADVDEQLWVHRNLGKAFYENPTTHAQAVEEFKKALDLAPDSTRERLNYGLALLRGGKTAEGILELEKVQKQDPSLPNTWFNLGIAFEKESDYGKAIQQFEQMIRLVPQEPVSHYHLGYLYELEGKQDLAIQFFEKSEHLGPNLAGPHFQLYNAYHALGRTADAERELKQFQEIKKLQAGAAIPQDLNWTIYAEIYDPVDSVAATDGTRFALKFEDKKLADGFDLQTAGLAVLDFDGDGHPDLLAWSARGVKIFKHGSAAVEAAGLEGIQGIVSIAVGDFNNDGFPDLCIVTTSGTFLYENRNGVFRRSSVQLPAGEYSKAIWLDYDHDYDLDLFLLGKKSVLMRNNGKAGFKDETASFPFQAGTALDAVVIDLDASSNGTDLVVSYDDRGAVIYRDQLEGKYQAEPLAALPAGSKWLIARDVNNDSWTDLTAGGPAGITVLLNREGKLQATKPLEPRPGPLAFVDFENRGYADLVSGGRIYRNQGLGKFQAGTPAFAGRTATALVACDFDGDGKTDLAMIDSAGDLRVFRNQTQTRNTWFEVALNGLKNLKLAPGSRIEVKAGAHYEKQTYTGVPLVFGLLTRPEIDTVRITWPNGLVQNEMHQGVGKAITYKEAQRLSGSCPMVFAWNGKKIEFITDVLGVAPLGAGFGDGKYFPVDHKEYIQIPRSSLALQDGHYEIRITEELREVSYIDAVHLMAVDHPSGTEVFTNERFKSPPFPDFRLYGVRRRIYPLAAHDDRGRDVLPKLLRRDGTYPDGFKRDYAGVAERHSLVLDFGKAAPDNRAVLIFNGWVDWADGSTFRAASQERKGGLLMPYLQVKDSQGRWRTVIEDMGIPAGKPKAIVVDISGKFLSASREVRVVTDLCLYWDEIFLSDGDEPPQLVVTTIELESAELRFRGFSKPSIHPQRKQPESFDYDKRMPFTMWNPTPGYYTRYGDVRLLLASVDDEMVIMGSGDELRLLFSSAKLPALQPGWQRDFLLLVDGWAKDQDANTAYSQSVEPLPFRGMSGYPYPVTQHFPDDAAHRRYREQYNTRPALRLLRPLPDLWSKAQ